MWTNPRINPSPASVESSFAIIRKIRPLPDVLILQPGQRHLALLEQTSTEASAAGPLLSHAVPTAAAMQSPTPGTTISGNSATFTWDAGIAVNQYLLRIGTTPGGSSDIYDGAPAATTSQAVTTLPGNGSTIYVRLFSRIGAAWYFNDYTYTSSLGLTRPRSQASQ